MYLVIVLLFLEFLPGKFDLIGIDFGLVQFLLNSQNFLFKFLVLNENVRQVKDILICVFLQFLNLVPFLLKRVKSLGKSSL